MGLYASVDIFSDLQFLPMTPVLGLMPNYSAGCGTFCAVFEATAKSLCPVDTGRLQASLIADTDGATYCEAMTDCEYAQYQEYGTWCMPAQPYFEIAVETAINAAFDGWKEAEISVFEEEQKTLGGYKSAFLAMASSAYSQSHSNESMGRSSESQYEGCMRTCESISNQIDSLMERIANLIESINTGSNKDDPAATDAIQAQIDALQQQVESLSERRFQVMEQGFNHLTRAIGYYVTAAVYEIQGDIHTADAKAMSEAITVSEQIQQYGGMLSPPATLIS